EADLEEDLPEAPLALGIHRVDERLIAVAKVDATPDRGAVDRLVGPGAIRELQRQALTVPAIRHRLRGDRARRHGANDATLEAFAASGYRTETVGSQGTVGGRRRHKGQRVGTRSTPRKRCSSCS